jgi:hypothetical protein
VDTASPKKTLTEEAKEKLVSVYTNIKGRLIKLLVNDLDKIRLLNESCDNVTDIDIEYDHFECEVSKVIDKHTRFTFVGKYNIY